MLIARVIVGALLLVFGRRLFWLFVSASGFAAGMAAANLLGVQSESVSLVIGIALGVLGAVAAVLFQKFAIVGAGLLAGAFIAVRVAAELGVHRGNSVMLLILFGGVGGAVLVSMMFDAALVGLSSLAGAALVGEGLGLQGTPAVTLVIVLFLVGIGVQSAWMRPKKRETPTKQ